MIEYLLTGGTGSLCKELINQLCEIHKKNNNIKGIRIFSRDELKQHNLKKELQNKDTPPIAFILGDIRDQTRITEAMKGVNVVVHAAALKQVPAAEDNPLEYIQTNTHGTENVMRACIANKVSKALFISTDKACEPTTLYGASKMCAEKLWLRSSIYDGGHGTVFSAVRYGNVIGSRGSIIELVNNLKDGEKIPITDPNMTRFWISLPNVSKFILHILDIMDQGCLYIPKMVSCSLSTMIKASTGTTEKDWQIIGRRNGEKLHELLINQEELFRTVASNIGNFSGVKESGFYTIAPYNATLWHHINEQLYSDNRNPLFTYDEKIMKDLLQ